MKYTQETAEDGKVRLSQFDNNKVKVKVTIDIKRTCYW